MWFVAGLIPMIVGFVYYSDALFGSTWKQINGFSDEYLAKANMGLVMGGAYLFCCFIAMMVTGSVLHQPHAFQLMLPEVMETGSETQQQFINMMDQYGMRFRTFNHGALHGGLLGIFFALPMVGVNALFERRSWKYILIHGVYWIISLGLMGGLLCATITYPSLG